MEENFRKEYKEGLRYYVKLSKKVIKTFLIKFYKDIEKEKGVETTLKKIIIAKKKNNSVLLLIINYSVIS